MGRRRRRRRERGLQSADRALLRAGRPMTLVAATLMIAGLLAFSLPSLAEENTSCSGEWVVVGNPGGVGSYLLDVAAVSPSDVWAVGYGWNRINYIPMVEHW